jgi:transitional endoplasmic reticulum ATPase
MSRGWGGVSVHVARAPARNGGRRTGGFEGPNRPRPAPAPVATEKPARASWADVGGLDKEVRRIRELVELPLRQPRVFARLGIDAPRGVLLHGPPGTGKTLLARVVAHETSVAFLALSGPEIIHRYYGESEAKLRELFQRARERAPSILFLDEIEAIAPRRETAHGEVEKRVVAQLLALMDGLEARGQVIVIAATNLPDALDPALRRPGRFDREIDIGIPDTAARRQILAIHTRDMPLAPDVDLGQLAALTHGFVGADLEALCREAAMTTLREAMAEPDGGGTSVSDDRLARLTVTMPHFLAARHEMEPSALRDVVVEVPHVRWAEIGGLDAVKRELQHAAEWPLRHPELLQRLGARPAKGVLLHGPPGTGKTLLARALASQAEVNFISIKGPALLSKYLGESERSIREIFKKARRAAPCVLFFDEIDALAATRGARGDDGHAGARITAQLLTEMDGVEDLKGVLVVAATNRKDRLDPALLRPGRFDLILEVPEPDATARAHIFDLHLRDKPLGGGVDPAELARRAAGFGGADIEMTCRRAALFALRRFLDAGEPREGPAPAIHMADLVAAIEETRLSRTAATSQMVGRSTATRS